MSKRVTQSRPARHKRAKSEHRSLLGKRELAAALSWSRPRLDRKLASDPHFPVADPGEGGRGPRFDLAAVHVHLAGAGARSASARPVDEPEAAGGDRLRVVSKAELARELDWSRPTLDRTIERSPHFPVLSRGDQAGGWRFILQDVFAYLAGRPLPSTLAGALKPRGLPIIEGEPVRLDGLTQEQIGIIAGFGEFLPKEPVEGPFKNAIRAIIETTRLSAHKLYDYFEQQHELGALSPSVAHAMMGALFDLAEKMLLGQERATDSERILVRTTFDGFRLEFISDFLPVAA